MERKTNIFDKIGTLVPGYRGYQEREGRRECDRQLRELISDKLKYVERNISLYSENTQFEKLSDIENMSKKVKNLKDLIQYSPYGASAFFSDSVIKETELENIYQHDLEILDTTNELEKIIKLNDLNSIRDKIEILEKSIIERNQYIKNI